MTLHSTRRRVVSQGDLPRSDGGIYNPGAVLVDGAIMLLCRREIDDRFTNSVFPECVVLDPASLDVVEHRALLRRGYLKGVRIEDFRCIDFNGMVLVVHTVVRADGIRPAISRIIDNRLEPFDDLRLPIETRPIEKNWVLFEHDAALHCLYSLDPLTVFRRHANGAWKLVNRKRNGWARLFERTLSNSTNLIPFEGGYLGFWHSIVDNRYVQGAFLLGPDLQIAYRTGVLLDGRDAAVGNKPGVLYVCSLVLQADRVLAFYGEGDAHTGVAIFDRKELGRELKQSVFRPVDAIRIRYEGGSMSDAFRALRTLEAFAAQRGYPLIKLYVPDRRVLQTMRFLQRRNVRVHAARQQDGYHCTLVGASGCIVCDQTGSEWSPVA